MDQQIFRKKEVSKILGLSTSSIDRAVKQGLLAEPVILGARRKGWRRSDLESFINRPNQAENDNSNKSLAYSKTWRSKIK